jgi:hypothetical protein
VAEFDAGELASQRRCRTVDAGGRVVMFHFRSSRATRSHATKGNTEEELARDMGFALWRSPFRVKRDQGIDSWRLIAEAVVEHLNRCGCRFRRLPASGGPPFSSRAHGDS